MKIKRKSVYIGLFVSVFIYLSVHIFDIDLFEVLIKFVHGMEQYEIDELIIPSFVFLLLTFVLNIFENRKKKIEEEKLKIYKAMLHSTHHILNNFLNKMQLFKIIAEETEGFPKDVLILYEETICNASLQIDKLSKINHIDEKDIRDSISSP